MFDTELRNRKVIENSKLVLYAGPFFMREILFLGSVILVAILTIIVFLAERFENINKSSTFVFTLSNLFNTILIGFILFFTISIVIFALMLIQPVLLRKQVIIDAYSIQIKYILIAVPIFTRNFNVDEGKIVVHSNGEEKTIKPVMGKEKMYLLFNDQKYFIRSFSDIDSDKKIKLASILHRRGLLIDTELSQQLPLDEM